MEEINNQSDEERINAEVIAWLAKNINTDNEDDCEIRDDQIKSMLDEQTAVMYLLVWPIWESRQFDGFFKIDSIKKAAKD